jgi:hypothetical protein
MHINDQPIAGANGSAVTMHIYEIRPRKDKRGVDLISDVLPFGRLWYSGTERNQLCAIYLAFLVWDSLCSSHTAIAETAARPSQGRRSRNVMTMLALS